MCKKKTAHYDDYQDMGKSVPMEMRKKLKNPNMERRDKTSQYGKNKKIKIKPVQTRRREQSVRLILPSKHFF